MNKKYLLRGGIIGLLIFLLAFIMLWIYASINMNCLLEPIQSINVGGASCHFKNYFSIGSFLYFIIPTFFGSLIGMLMGVLYDKISLKNSRIIKICISIIIVLASIYLWRSLI
ncbi:MAG: hypothetical protein A3G04_02805 [Candidatus Taylorbacteria bacterium RIFCSPLOWO2_12_FULL_44_9]|nr:MAG: hypothetical protein A3G04_02805 [Candidatus Taylorbacteria bacterium RIFCSPLOWO2_12_FULL_44_9]